MTIKTRRWADELAERWRDGGLYRDAERLGASLVHGTPFWIEAPNRDGASELVVEALERGENVGDGRPAIAVVRRKGRAPVVAMTLDTFEALLVQLRTIHPHLVARDVLEMERAGLLTVHRRDAQGDRSQTHDREAPAGASRVSDHGTINNE